MELEVGSVVGLGGWGARARDAAVLQLALGEGGQPGAAGDKHDVEADEGDAVDEEESVGGDAAAGVEVREVAHAAEGGGQGVGSQDVRWRGDGGGSWRWWWR